MLGNGYAIDKDVCEIDAMCRPDLADPEMGRARGEAVYTFQNLGIIVRSCGIAKKREFHGSRGIFTLCPALAPISRLWCNAPPKWAFGGSDGAVTTGYTRLAIRCRHIEFIFVGFQGPSGGVVTEGDRG